MSVRVKYSDELYHHGILGQKWGVRRYQNPDGSYTEEGLRRYGRAGADVGRRYVRNVNKGVKDTQDNLISSSELFNKSYSRLEKNFYNYRKDPTDENARKLYASEESLHYNARHYYFNKLRRDATYREAVEEIGKQRVKLPKDGDRQDAGLFIGGGVGAAAGAGVGTVAGIPVGSLPGTAAGAIFGTGIGGTAGMIIGDVLDKKVRYKKFGGSPSKVEKDNYKSFLEETKEVSTKDKERWKNASPENYLRWYREGYLTSIASNVDPDAFAMIGYDLLYDEQD